MDGVAGAFDVRRNCVCPSKQIAQVLSVSLSGSVAQWSCVWATGDVGATIATAALEEEEDGGPPRVADQLDGGAARIAAITAAAGGLAVVDNITGMATRPTAVAGPLTAAVVELEVLLVEWSCCEGQVVAASSPAPKDTEAKGGIIRVEADCTPIGTKV